MHHNIARADRRLHTVATQESLTVLLARETTGEIKV
jgi:hypothetical protein